MYISSIINIGLFTVKSVISMVKDIRNKDKNLEMLAAVLPDGDIDDPQYAFFKSFTVHNRPYFKWKLHHQIIN